MCKHCPSQNCLKKIPSKDVSSTLSSLIELRKIISNAIKHLNMANINTTLYQSFDIGDWKLGMWIEYMTYCMLRYASSQVTYHFVTYIKIIAKAISHMKKYEYLDYHDADEFADSLKG